MYIYNTIIDSMDTKVSRSDYLVSRSSFTTGFGSIVALHGWRHKYNTSNTANEADRRALKNDWAMIGQDLSRAIFKKKNV